MTALIIALIGSALLNLALYRQSSERKSLVNVERLESKQARLQASRVAERFAELAGLDGKEQMELLAEQGAVVRVKSDIWDVPLPYGRWQSFPDPDGDPEPLIRGFWLDMAGRLIGVKMPIGSKYIMHSHPWRETLIGVVGTVEVEIEDERGNVTTHPLGPGAVVRIPEHIKHAVIHAEEFAEFVCIWGVPNE